MNSNKPWLIGIVFLLVSFVGNSQEFSLQVIIDGESANGKKVFLRDADKYLLDSTHVKGNQVVFNGEALEPALFSLYFVDNAVQNPNFHPVIPVFVESGNIKVFAHIDSLSQEVHFKTGQYDYNLVRVEGSTVHQNFLAYVNEFENYFQSRKKAFRAYLDFLNYDEPDSRVSTGIDLVNKVDQESKKRDDFVFNYIKNNPESPISFYAAKESMSNFSKQELEKLASVLNVHNLDTKSGKALSKQIEEARKTAVGSDFIDMSFKDTSGTEHKLSDYLGKGKYVLLEFWASWCVPCRADIPHLKQLYELYKDSDFEIISVSMDSKEKDWLQAVKEEQMPWLQISDLEAFKGDVARSYNLTGIPTCLLINPDGEIISRNMRGSWLDGFLVETFGNRFDSQDF